MARTYWICCISLCSSILQLLNLDKSFDGHPVSFQGWVARLPLPGHFTSVSPSRIAQKDCQNRKREIEYMPLETCPFLTTANFQSLFSMWLCFLPNKEGRQSGEHELICCPSCLRMGLRNARNLESGMREFTIFQIFTCWSIPFLFVENHSTFTVFVWPFNIQMLNKMSKKPWLIKALRNP